MHFRQNIIARPAVISITTIALLLVIALDSCREPTPASYPMRAALPFGTVHMSVNSTEVSSDLDKQSILVYVRMESLEGQEQARVASQSWNQWFTLADQTGKKYRCRRLLPADEYYRNFSQVGGANKWGRPPQDQNSFSPTQWILHFDVPLEVRGFTLIINNSTFHTSGQPEAIAVKLDL
jgi:hypothetical protein